MIEKVAVQINWNRWYFDEENDYGKVSEGFSDQKNQLKTLQSYLKDILSEDWIKKNRIWNYLSDRTKGDNSSLTFSLSKDYFIKAISKKRSSETNFVQNRDWNFWPSKKWWWNQVRKEISFGLTHKTSSTSVMSRRDARQSVWGFEAWSIIYSSVNIIVQLNDSL